MSEPKKGSRGTSANAAFSHPGTVCEVFVLALILFVLAVVAVVTGVLGLTGSLPRNRFFGVHTEAALRTDETFRVANRVAAPTSFGAGVLLAAGGMIALLAGGIVGLIGALLAAVIALFVLGAGANAGAGAIAGLASASGGCGQACGACSLRDACRSAD
ncbi:SdpI family protein [Nocardia sp. BMG51109]|uniref:SdpI family protein n=1 Tax=Nocardia sp. BMG51109 TaxID=1056816 RepID=UPI001E55F949|nr:SdpI family protein [Nocardia sp. BMG51109]